jgi:hypothetical protein
MAINKKLFGKLVETFLRSLNQANYFTPLLIPFTGNSFRAFGKKNILSAHTNYSGELIYIRTKRDVNEFEQLNNFIFKVEVGDASFLVFRVPDFLKSDLLKILRGKYTEMNNTTKEIICVQSGLQYTPKLLTHSLFAAHPILQALYSHSHLREAMANVYELEYSLISEELLPKHESNSNIYIENFIKLIENE